MRDEFRTASAPSLRSRLVSRQGEGAEDAPPTLFGHFSMFNSWTLIDSAFEGRFLERVAPGAFARTIAEDRSRMRVLFQHGRDPVVADKPLGVIETLREDDIGAAYTVRMLDTRYNAELIPGLKAGVYGASFRFQVRRENVDQSPGVSSYNEHGLPERTILDARVLEFGPVTFGAYDTATAGVRSLTDRFRVER